MSEAMGPLTFGKKEEQIFLGREIAQHQDYSEDTAVKIDQEVKRIVAQNYERAQDVADRAQGRAAEDRRRTAGARGARRRAGEAHRPGEAARRPRPSGRSATAVVSDRRARRRRRPPRATGRRPWSRRSRTRFRSSGRIARPQGTSSRRGRSETDSRGPGDRALGVSSRPPFCHNESAVDSIADRRDLRPSRSPHGRASTLGERTLVMGILNVTPDSFAERRAPIRTRRSAARPADGGRGRRHHRHRRRIDAAGRRAGVGGRGAWPACCRSSSAWRAAWRVPISIDTYKAGVAEAALAAGAVIVNDISGLRV